MHRSIIFHNERIEKTDLERNGEGDDVLQERVLEGELGVIDVVQDGGGLSGEIVGSGDDVGPGLLALNEARVGGFGAEDEEEGEGGGGELVGEGGGAEEGEEVGEDVED